MDGFTWAAFACYLWAMLGGALSGFTYLFRSKFVPYHQEALGQSWDQLDKRLQTLLIALMRTTGGALVGGVISVVIILFIPFRADELWAHYAIPGVGLISFLPGLYATLIVRTRTHASTPVAFVASGVAFIIIGFILSFF
jgi:hypothetical protein